MALLDRYGNPVTVGDTVTLSGTVELLGTDMNYVNCTVVLDQLMPPSQAQTRVQCNTTQLDDPNGAATQAAAQAAAQQPAPTSGSAAPGSWSTPKK